MNKEMLVYNRYFTCSPLLKYCVYNNKFVVAEIVYIKKEAEWNSSCFQFNAVVSS